MEVDRGVDGQSMEGLMVCQLMEGVTYSNMPIVFYSIRYLVLDIGKKLSYKFCVPDTVKYTIFIIWLDIDSLICMA